MHNVDDGVEAKLSMTWVPGSMRHICPKIADHCRLLRLSSACENGGIRDVVVPADTNNAADGFCVAFFCSILCSPYLCHIYKEHLTGCKWHTILSLDDNFRCFVSAMLKYIQTPYYGYNSSQITCPGPFKDGTGDSIMLCLMSDININF